MMRWNWATVVFMAAVMWIPLTSACNKFEMQRVHQLKESKARDVSKSQLKMGTHDVTVMPGAEVTAHSEMMRNQGDRVVEHFEFNVGEIRIVIEDEKLYVNELYYGGLEKGDTVLVDHERVYVNGRPVEGRTLQIPIIIERTKPVKIPTVA